MKKNINVIQIKGIRGLIIAGFVVSCLIAGFIAFPGIISMIIWNWVASHTLIMPTIGIFQGVLLWGILVAAYFTFVKEKFVVCMKTPQGLNEDELKAVFADVKKQAEEDKIIQAMIKAREAELNLKKTEENKDDSQKIETH